MATGVALFQLAGPYLAFRALCHLVSVKCSLPGVAASRATSRRVSPSVLATHRGWRSCSATDDCLPRPRTLPRLSQQASIRGTLLCGRAGESLAGHAWVTVGGQAIEASPDSTPALIPTCVFGARGRLVSAM
jgi:hypothetical protein